MNDITWPQDSEFFMPSISFHTDPLLISTRYLTQNISNDFCQGMLKVVKN